MLRRWSVSPYAVALSAVLLALLLATGFRLGSRAEWPGQAASPLLLVAVVISAWHGGTGPGLLAASLSILCLEYLFLPPVRTLDVGWMDVPRFVAFAVASFLVGQLTARRRHAETTLSQTEEKLHAARLVQQRLFPARAPQLPGFDVAGASFPANSVGGDFYDYIPLRSGALGIVIGDVSGHGLGPALLMAETRSYLRALALTHADIGDILTSTNRILAEDMDEQFITMFFAALEPSTRTLTYAGAGHEAYLLDPAGPIRRLCSTSLPLGLERDLVVACAAPVQLAPGQTVLLFTDGTYEASTRDGSFFGIERVLEAAQSRRAQSAREIVNGLHNTVRAFARHRPQADDITMIALKVDAA